MNPPYSIFKVLAINIIGNTISEPKNAGNHNINGLKKRLVESLPKMAVTFDRGVSIYEKVPPFDGVPC